MFIISAAVLIAIAIMMNLLVPRILGRGYSNPTEEELYEPMRTADMD